MSATAAQVVAVLVSMDVRAELVTVDTGVCVETGVNVWRDSADRVPADTVWAPSPAIEGGGWTWGDAFQHGTYADADAESVAYRILETLPKRETRQA